MSKIESLCSVMDRKDARDCVELYQKGSKWVVATWHTDCQCWTSVECKTFLQALAVKENYIDNLMQGDE